MRFIRGLDFFIKTKEEFDQSTTVGGLFSLIAFGIGVLFFIIELSSFLKTEVIKEMAVDNDVLTRQETANIDFVFYRLPCHLMSIYKSEADGLSQGELSLKLERYHSKTDSLSEYVRNKHQEHLPGFFEDMKAAINDDQGCKVSGQVAISEIPGAIEFGIKELGHYYRMLHPEQQMKITVAFQLNHLSFGDTKYHNKIYNTFMIKSFGLNNSFSPYDGDDHSDIAYNQKLGYYVKIVPNEYFNNKKTKSQRAYQFSLTYNSKRFEYNEFPSFILQYEFSPIVVNYTRQRNSLARFIVDTLAIIGGVFAVVGMINSFVLSKFKHLRKL